MLVHAFHVFLQVLALERHITVGISLLLAPPPTTSGVKSY
jgi:hypothetical protein